MPKRSTILAEKNSAAIRPPPSMMTAARRDAPMTPLKTAPTPAAALPRKRDMTAWKVSMDDYNGKQLKPCTARFRGF